MKQRGFTLLEVLVAFAILVTVGVALFEASGTALGLHAKARNITRATLVAESRMAEVIATHAASQPTTHVDGDCETQVDVTPWRDSTATGTLLEVRVRARCGASDVTLTTVVVRPVR